MCLMLKSANRLLLASSDTEKTGKEGGDSVSAPYQSQQHCLKLSEHTDSQTDKRRDQLPVAVYIIVGHLTVLLQLLAVLRSLLHAVDHHRQLSSSTYTILIPVTCIVTSSNILSNVGQLSLALLRYALFLLLFFFIILVTKKCLQLFELFLFFCFFSSQAIFNTD